MRNRKEGGKPGDSERGEEEDRRGREEMGR